MSKKMLYSPSNLTQIRNFSGRTASADVYKDRKPRPWRARRSENLTCGRGSTQCVGFIRIYE